MSFNINYMVELVIKSKEFAFDYACFELERFKCNYLILNNEYFLIKFSSIDKMVDFLKLFYSSSVCFSCVYYNLVTFNNFEDFNIKKKSIKNSLDFVNGKKKYFLDFDIGDEFIEKFKIDCNKFLSNLNNNLEYSNKLYDLKFKIFSVSDKLYFGLDLIGFDLLDRDNKLHFGNSHVTSLVWNYCFYLLGLCSNYDEKVSLIDPVAGYGDLLIEFSTLGRDVRNKKRYGVVFAKLFGISLPIVKNIRTNAKVLGVVTENDIFKKINENIRFSRADIKVSKYSLDWLDVKFNENSIDYALSSFVGMEEDDINFGKILNEYFHQVKYICKEKFCCVMSKPIDRKYLIKNRIKVLEKKEIKEGGRNLFIYILK